MRHQKGKLSGAKKALWWSAALLLGGGPVLGIFLGSVEVAAVVFGLGAVQLGMGQLWASDDRSGRFIGFVLLLGGAFTILDAGIFFWVSSGGGA
ncbi:MAG: hypothetical protein IN808_00625 [Rubrobacter sp.]|nr:hypothetical protein [Rubrobacter sp.]